ncbi:MAG: TRAP transporter substrate-binding protein DctP [Verrucomicrobia bacterium]|nr:TRAP transporter substrate-binding protein DctP [Verrucomicrobiota bacterium]
MNHRVWLSCWLAFSLGVAGTNLGAADKVVNLRLGTLAPNGTSYHKSLQAMGEKWKEASGGVVKLTIFPGGTQGGEADMVGLMQTGNLDAGLLTAVGLSEIEPAVSALQSMPMSFRNLDEVDYVGEKLRPLLEKRLSDKGYIVLFWTDSGWVRFFTKRLVLHPDDLRKHKIFSWAGNAHEYDLWKSTGFHPVSLETAGIAQGLLSGTIDALAMPPFFALSGHLDGQTRHMLELNWAPLVGALVVRKKSWDQVPADAREAMLKIALDIGKQVKADGRAESESSVAAMAKRGLIVQTVTPEVEEEWRTVVEKVQNEIRGKIVPADMFDEAQRLLKEYRAAGGGKPK